MHDPSNPARRRSAIRAVGLARALLVALHASWAAPAQAGVGTAGVGTAGVGTAGILAQVDQSAQRMRVYVDGTLAHVWPVSTARAGYVTPNGRFRVGRMEPFWRSRKYRGAPMPHALFFRGGYAIHGTGDVGRLGRRASHGCVRLAPAHARTLFGLTARRGGARVSIMP